MASRNKELSASFFSVSFAFCSLSPMEVKSVKVSAICTACSLKCTTDTLPLHTACLLVLMRKNGLASGATHRKALRNIRNYQSESAGTDNVDQSDEG